MKYRSTSLDIFTWPFTTYNTYICAFSAKWSNNMKTMACKFLHFLAVQTNHSWESTPSCDGSLGQSTWRSWSRRILGHRPLLRPLLIKLNGGRYFGPMEKIYPRVNSHIYGKLMVSLGKSSTFTFLCRRWSPQGPRGPHPIFFRVRPCHASEVPNDYIPLEKY